MDFTVIAVVFGVILVAELPDKSMFASLALSARFRRSYIWLGAAAAFLVHVTIATTAGQFMTLLPHRLLELIVGLLFLTGAALLAFGGHESKSPKRSKPEQEAQQKRDGFLKVFATSFAVVFLGEWGDITQIATANYAAKYNDPLSVGIGATAALWGAAALSIGFGAKLLDRVPARILHRATAGVLLAFAAVSLTAAYR